MADFINSALAWLLSVITDVAGWVVDIVKAGAAWIWDLLLSGAAALFEAIPVPEFFTTAHTSMGQIPAGVLYLVEPFNVGTGLALIMSAYVARFILKRIPIIG